MVYSYLYYIYTIKNRVICMKKLLTVASLLCFIQSAQGMLPNIRNNSCAENKDNYSLSQATMRVSEKSYQNWQDISKDVAELKLFFKGAFDAVGEANRPDIKPSLLLKFLRDDAQIDEKTQLGYMPASLYMHRFITETDYDYLDALCVKKYKEIKDTKETWNYLHDHFVEKVVKESVSKFAKDLLEKDAARVVLAEQGVFCKGRTIVFDGSSMSDKPEDRKKVRDAFDVLMRE